MPRYHGKMTRSTRMVHGGKYHYEIDDWLEPEGAVSRYPWSDCIRRGDSIHVRSPTSTRTRGTFPGRSVKASNGMAWLVWRAGQGLGPNRQLGRIFKTWRRTTRIGARESRAACGATTFGGRNKVPRPTQTNLGDRPVDVSAPD
jgi:hypothetical protein